MAWKIFKSENAYSFIRIMLNPIFCCKWLVKNSVSTQIHRLFGSNNHNFIWFKPQVKSSSVYRIYFNLKMSIKLNLILILYAWESYLRMLLCLLDLACLKNHNFCRRIANWSYHNIWTILETENVGIFVDLLDEK